jgi:AbrB family looped-hinge helix DNA binding protein
LIGRQLTDDKWPYQASSSIDILFLPGYYENYNFLFLEAKGMQHGKEPSGMALVRLKRAAQITLPAELRKRFHLEEGDYLEVEAVENGILLKPVAFIGREKAWEKVREVLDRVHAKLPPSDQSPREQEEEITRIIKELRQDDAAERRP